MSAGRVIAESNNVEELLAYPNLNVLNRVQIKSRRLHEWTPGREGAGLKWEHCKNCQTIRQRYGRIDDKPCRQPEKSDDPTVEVINYHAEHTDDRCCPEHNHHAKFMHVGCIMR